MTKPRAVTRIIHLIRYCTSVFQETKLLALCVLELVALVYALVWLLRR